MTPKEEAIELLQKFYNETYIIDKAITLALICVDMIVESHIGWATEQQEYLEHYENVKHELNLMKIKHTYDKYTKQFKGKNHR